MLSPWSFSFGKIGPWKFKTWKISKEVFVLFIIDKIHPFDKIEKITKSVLENSDFTILVLVIII